MSLSPSSLGSKGIINSSSSGSQIGRLVAWIYVGFSWDSGPVVLWLIADVGGVHIIEVWQSEIVSGCVTASSPKSNVLISI